MNKNWKSGREKKKCPWKKENPSNSGRETKFLPMNIFKNDTYVSKIKSGHENSQKEQNYGRETKMLPVNKVAKKRAKIGVHGHFLVSRGKK